MSIKKNEIEVWLTCQECDGEGYYEVGPECSQPASNCCGGCYRRELCTLCESGSIPLLFDAEQLGTLLEHVRNNELEDAKDCITEAMANT